MFIRSDVRHITCCQSRCRDEPQPKNGRALTAPPSTARHRRRVNASCKHLSSLWVCVCVWFGLATGASLRLYLRHDKTTCNIRASGAPLQTQPYLTPNIPRGQSRARVAQTRPDKTSHRLTVSRPIREPSARRRGAQAGSGPSKCVCACLRGAFYERSLRQLRTTVRHYSDGNHLLRVFLPPC